MDEGLRNMLGFFIFIFLAFYIAHKCEPDDPYQTGSHFDYAIICSHGYKYKKIQGGIIPCKNSDGTLLKCNQKRY